MKIGTSSRISIFIRHLSVIALLFILTACNDNVPEKVDAQAQPNILMVVLDDFGYNDLAINNDSDSPTPTLDKIAQSGIRYTRHYAESSCTASRVALLTGLYPAKVGALPGLSGIDPEFETLADALSNEGYTNYMIGKWHTGDAHPEARPEHQGFDHWLGFMSQLYLRGPHDTSVQGSDRYRRAHPSYRNPWLENELGELKQFKGHLTDLLTDQALDVMKTKNEKWFIYLSYYAPHSPIQPSKPFGDRYPQNESGKYQALKSQLDSNLERIYSYLEKSGQLKNTLVVIVSDNGGTANSWPSNLPFHGEKGSYAEGGVRTPLILSWRGHWPQDQVNDKTAMIFDLYPTVLNAVGGATPENLDGVDLFASPKDRVLRWYSHDRWGDKYGMLSSDGRWRINIWGSAFEQLQSQQDIRSGAQINRWEEQPEIARTMHRSMQEWIRSTTRVGNLTTADSDSWRSYSGYGFRRTPMTDTLTMAFVFQRGSQSTTTKSGQTLVSQEGYLQISELNGRLSIELDGNIVEVPSPDDEQHCLRLIVQSALVKKNKVFHKSPSQIRVYVNGVLAGESRFKNTILNKASPKNPLRVALNSKDGWFMPASADAYISSRFLPIAEIKTTTDPMLSQACDLEK